MFDDFSNTCFNDGDIQKEIVNKRDNDISFLLEPSL